MKHKKQAFTLVEMLAVVSLVAILFIIFIPRIDFATNKVKEAGIMADFRSYQLAFNSASMNKMDLLEQSNQDLVNSINKYLDSELQIKPEDNSIEATDPWGTPYRFLLDTESKSCYMISAGQDKELSEDTLLEDTYKLVYGEEPSTVVLFRSLLATNSSNSDNYALAVRNSSDGLEISTGGLNKPSTPSTGSNSGSNTDNGTDSEPTHIEYFIKDTNGIKSDTYNIMLNGSIAFKAYGVYEGGSEQEITDGDWSSSVESVATIDNYSGVVNVLTPGTTTITYTSDNQIMSVELVVILDQATYEKNVIKYYTFTADTTTGGVRVGLASEFKAVLNSADQTDYEEWSKGDPLPELRSTYDGDPVTSLSQMFEKCTLIQTLDLSRFDTSNVKDMSKMFLNCRALTSIDVTSFDTSEVTNMSKMFNACVVIESIDVSSFDTSKVTNMSSMFDYCSSVTSLDLRDFDTSKVTNMNKMFSGCKSLQTLDISSFDTSEVTNMGQMFFSCGVLRALDVSKFKTNNVTTMESMFQNCKSIQTLDLRSFDTSKVENMEMLFSGCNNLQSLDLTSFNTDLITDMSYMFANCNSLESVDLSSFNTSNVTEMFMMFSDCFALKTLDLSSFDITKTTEMRSIFVGCTSVTEAYGRTVEDCEKFNSISTNPENINFQLK